MPIYTNNTGYSFSALANSISAYAYSFSSWLFGKRVEEKSDNNVVNLNSNTADIRIEDDSNENNFDTAEEFNFEVQSNESDVEMPSLIQPAIGVLEALTSLLADNSASIVWHEQGIEFENAYGRKAYSKAEILEVLQITEDEYLAQKLQSEEKAILQAKQDQEANDAAMADLLQQDELGAAIDEILLKKQLEAEALEDEKVLKAKREQVANDAILASKLQAEEEAGYNFDVPVELPQAHINWNGYDYDRPDFTIAAIGVNAAVEAF